MSAGDKPTRPTLLGRLRDESGSEYKAAWAEFVELYGPPILRWLRRFPNEDDRHEVFVRILDKLAKRLKTFDYDPEKGGFRGYLFRVCQNACNDAARELRDRRWNDDPAVLEAALAEKAIRQLSDSLPNDAEAEYDEIYQRARANVRDRLAANPSANPLAWQAYVLTEPVGLGGEALTNPQAAERLGAGVVFVARAKNRIHEHIAQEARRLQGLSAVEPRDED